MLHDLKRFEDALASYDKAIALKPDYAEAYNNRGNALKDLKRFEEALASYDKAIALKPDCEFLYGELVHTKMMICDWSDLEGQIAQLAAKIEHREPASSPFAILSLTSSLRLQRSAAEIYVLAKYPPSNMLAQIAKRQKGDKIRIGYFSADFREHPVSIMAAELFEGHDRSRFEVTAFSIGWDTKDAMRKRLEASFDKFIDVRNNSDRDVALLARKLEIDIAVDLGGFIADTRTNIFAMRTAPIQVNYFGYPGTMGAVYMDYVIADPTVIPVPHQQHYAERIAYLPNSYMPNDSRRPISDRLFDRAEFGLPQAGFVFCCFNNKYKICTQGF